MGGEQHARYATKSHGAIAAKYRASEGDYSLEPYPWRAALTSSSDLRSTNIYY